MRALKLKIIVNKLTSEYEKMCAVNGFSEYSEDNGAYGDLHGIERHLCKSSCNSGSEGVGGEDKRLVDAVTHGAEQQRGYQSRVIAGNEGLSVL